MMSSGRVGKLIEHFQTRDSPEDAPPPVPARVRSDDNQHAVYNGSSGQMSAEAPPPIPPRMKTVDPSLLLTKVPSPVAADDCSDLLMTRVPLLKRAGKYMPPMASNSSRLSEASEMFDVEELVPCEITGRFNPAFRQDKTNNILCRVECEQPISDVNSTSRCHVTSTESSSSVECSSIEQPSHTSPEASFEIIYEDIGSFPAVSSVSINVFSCTLGPVYIWIQIRS